MALPFLPQEHIVKAYLQLEQQAPDAIIPVMDYVYSTWINNSIFKIHQWSVFMSPVRTNNDVEEWHSRFNSNVTRGPVPFYQLVTELYAESTDIPVQLKLVSEGKLKRYQRKRNRQIQGMETVCSSRNYHKSAASGVCPCVWTTSTINKLTILFYLSLLFVILQNK